MSDNFEFVLKYNGSTEMPPKYLANVLMGMHEIMHAGSEVVFSEHIDFGLQVMDISQSSVMARFVAAMKSEEAKALLVLSGLLSVPIACTGLAISASGYSLKDYLEDSVKEQEVASNPFTATDSQKRALDLFDNDQVRDGIEKIASPIELPQFESMTSGVSGGKLNEFVSKGSLGRFKSVHYVVEEDPVEEQKGVRLLIANPNMLGADGWAFKNIDGSPIEASMDCPDFLKDVKARNFKVATGDSIIADLHIVRKRRKRTLKPKISIVKVHDFTEEDDNFKEYLGMD